VAEGEEMLMQGMVILDPEWLAEALRCIITWTQGFVQSRGGLVDEQLLRIIWSDNSRYPEWLHGWLMQLLVHFELAYPATDQQRDSLQPMQEPNEENKHTHGGQQQEEPLSPTSPLPQSLSQLAQEGATAQLKRRVSLRAQHSPVQPQGRARHAPLNSAPPADTTSESAKVSVATTNAKPKGGESTTSTEEGAPCNAGWVYVVPALLPEEEPDMAAEYSPPPCSAPAECTESNGSNEQLPFPPGLWDPTVEFAKSESGSDVLVLGSEYRFRGSIPPGFVSRLLVRLQQLRQLEAEAAEAAARTVSAAGAKGADTDRVAASSSSRTAIQCWRTGALVHYDGMLHYTRPLCRYVHQACLRILVRISSPRCLYRTPRLAQSAQGSSTSSTCTHCAVATCYSRCPLSLPVKNRIATSRPWAEQESSACGQESSDCSVSGGVGPGGVPLQSATFTQCCYPEITAMVQGFMRGCVCVALRAST
jgi:hypothetical protein